MSSAGRIGDVRETTLYSTLMPSYLGAGAIIQFGIEKLVVGESERYSGKFSSWLARGLGERKVETMERP